MDIIQIILRKPELTTDNEYVKQLLLKQFKIISKTFKKKFMRLQYRRFNLYKDQDLKFPTCFEYWHNGLEITKFKF